MRRPPANYGYQPVPQNNHDELEQENERIAEELKNKISNLKSLTIDIGELNENIPLSCLINNNMMLYILGNEVRYQDKILNDLDDDLSRTGGFMQNTIGRVIRLRKTGRGFTCYMILFAFVVFLILYLVLKLR